MATKESVPKEAVPAEPKRKLIEIQMDAVDLFNDLFASCRLIVDLVREAQESGINLILNEKVEASMRTIQEQTWGAYIPTKNGGAWTVQRKPRQTTKDEHKTETVGRFSTKEFQEMEPKGGVQ